MPFDGNIVERWSVKGLFGFGYANSKECTLTTVIWAVAAGLLLFQQGRSLMSQTGWEAERPLSDEVLTQQTKPARSKFTGLEIAVIKREATQLNFSSLKRWFNQICP